MKKKAIYIPSKPKDKYLQRHRGLSWQNSSRTDMDKGQVRKIHINLEKNFSN